jgi:TIR domain
MREARLPALVGKLGSEPQVGRSRPLGRVRGDQHGPGQVPADCDPQLHPGQRVRRSFVDQWCAARRWPILITCQRWAVGLLVRGGDTVHPDPQLSLRPDMGDRRPRVFVSHSSHSPDEKDRLEAIVSSLQKGEDRVDVLYDKAMINGGDEWRKAISALLWECDAAIVLLTSGALESGWVLREAAFLRSRYDRNPDFKLLVWTDIGRAELKSNKLWNPLDLTEIQFVSGSSASEIAASVKKILAPLAAQLQPTPLDLLAEDIVNCLPTGLKLHLQAALNSLGEQIPIEIGEQSQRLAYGIARWMLRQPPPALKRVAQTLAMLGNGLPSAKAISILELLAPMWVDPHTAAWFVLADWRNPSCRDVAIVCAKPLTTLKQCVYCANMPDVRPPYLLLNNITGGAQSDDVAQQLRTLLRPCLKRGSGPAPDDAAIDDFLNGINYRIYVALELPNDPEVTKALQSLYKRVTFVFYVPRDRYPPDSAPPLPDGVGWVVPPLDPYTEAEMDKDYSTALSRFSIGEGFGL